jgi:hypothetical protein|tara:strand:- start:306 stop:428 length:123 start_codon:yes stop_codon:yes gene_type:complete
MPTNLGDWTNEPELSAEELEFAMSFPPKPFPKIIDVWGKM